MVFEQFIGWLEGFWPRFIWMGLIALGGWILYKVIALSMNRMIRHTKNDTTVHLYLQRVIKVVIIVLAIMMMLGAIGVPVNSLITVLAAAGAAIALAVQENLANLASGMVLLMTRPFKVDDFIEVDGSMGKVSRISLIYTYIDTPGNMQVGIPNTKMINNKIINHNIHPERRIDFTFSIGYGDDLLCAKDVLQKVADSHPKVLHDRPMRIAINNYGENAMELVMHIWCSSSDYWDVNFEIREQVKLAFDQAGLKLPVRKVDVNILEKPD